METTSTDITSESLEKVYKRYSHYYDLVFGAVFHPGRQMAIDQLQCQSGDRILEVGVGTGLSLRMYPFDVRVTGIDLSQDMLNRAQEKVNSEKLGHVEALIQMNAQEMSFPDNSFDKVVAMYVASVVPDVQALVSEMRRVCKPGGQMVFLNHFENRNPVIRKAESVIQPLAKHLGFSPQFPLDEFLQKTGFKAEKEIPVNFMKYWTVLVGRNDKVDTSVRPDLARRKRTSRQSRPLSSLEN